MNNNDVTNSDYYSNLRYKIFPFTHYLNFELGEFEV